MVARIRSNYGLKVATLDCGRVACLPCTKSPRHLDVSPVTAKVWRRAGLLRAHRYNDKGQCLFEQAGPDAPIKYQWQRNNRVKSAPSKATLNSRNS